MARELYDFINEGMADFEAVIGEDLVSFTIAGASGTFTGDLDQSGAHNVMLMEDGGLTTEFSGTILARRAQFAAVSNPERTLEGKRLTVGSRAFRIAGVAADPASLTFTLESADKRK